MARRRYGSGSIRLRSDGRWEGRIRLPDGSRRFLYGRATAGLEAQEERWRIAAGIPRRANGLTLREYLPEWLQVCRKRLRPKTFESYALCVHRLEVELGRVPLIRLTPLMVQSAYVRFLVYQSTPRLLQLLGA